MAFDQENYYARNHWRSIHIPPYRDLREPPKPKRSRAQVFAEVAVTLAAGVCILVIVLGW